jgi:hypothetical protein
MSESMNTETEHHLFERPLPCCPSCGCPNLEPVAHGGDVDYLCVDCRARWHVELGAFWRVDGLGPDEHNPAATEASV